MSGKGEGHGAGMPVAYLNNVELWQQVAVSQCEVVSIKEMALGDPEVGVLGQLMLQRGTQVLIQLQQGPQQAPLQCCRDSGQVIVPPCSAVAYCQPSPAQPRCPGSTCQPLPTWLRVAPASALPQRPGIATLAHVERAVPGQT